MAPRIESFDGGIDLIHLTPPLEGFADFIGVWLHAGPPAFLVDVGPAATAEDLLAALCARGVARLDYLLLTHIHLDHAGAAGRIAAAFPQAAVVCHAKALPHLADPGRLWEGSRKVLGEVADGYGRPEPVEPGRLLPAERLVAGPIRALETPGHAVHHVSYLTPAALFIGEAAGVWYPMGGGEGYQRPATPPPFFLDSALASLDALLALAPGRTAVGHLGLCPDGRALIARHRRQLVFWEAWLARRLDRFPEDDAARAALEGLAAEDPLLANLPRFPPAARRREEYFLSNSLAGIIGWVRSARRVPQPAPVAPRPRSRRSP